MESWLLLSLPPKSRGCRRHKDVYLAAYEVCGQVGIAIDLGLGETAFDDGIYFFDTAVVKADNGNPRLLADFVAELA